MSPEVLSFAHGPDGSHPPSWGYREGQHWRTVLLGGTPVTLAASYASVTAVLGSNAAPRASVNVIGHDRWPDFNTLPAGPGTTHQAIRDVIRAALAGTGPQRRAYLRDAAQALAAGLGDGPADLRADYARPLTRALAASLGFPASEWDSCVLAPASVQQGLLGDGDGQAARDALTDLLGYCAGLARRLDDGSFLAAVAGGLKERGLSHLTWHVLRTLATGSITPDTVLAAYLRKRAAGYAGLGEIMRTAAYFGLMNPRGEDEPIPMPDGPDLPAGTVICSMDAALHDPGVFPIPYLFASSRPETTLPWGAGPHACPFYRDSRALIEEADAALDAAWPGGCRVTGELVFADGLLPVPQHLVAASRAGALVPC